MEAAAHGMPWAVQKVKPAIAKEFVRADSPNHKVLASLLMKGKR